MNQLAVMSKRLKIDEQELNSVIMNTIMPAKTAVSTEEITTFLMLANEYGLNPLAKEVYAFPAKGGGIQTVVSIDGWLRVINEHPQMNGMTVEFSDKVYQTGNVNAPEACTVTIYRKDRERPTVITEYLQECFRGTDPWKQKPRRMLQHKAVIQAARYAFGFGGIVDQDEAENIRDMGNAVVVPETTSKGDPINFEQIYEMLWNTIESCDCAEDIEGLSNTFKDPKSDFKKLPDEAQKKLRRYWRSRKNELSAPLDAAGE